jgi:HEAT repeats
MPYGRLLRMVAVVAIAFTVSRPATPDELPQPRPAGEPQKKAWGILWAGTHDESTTKRSKATNALGLLSNDTEAASLPQSQLQDKEPEVRAAAAAALGEMHSAASIPKLESSALHQTFVSKCQPLACVHIIGRPDGLQAGMPDSRLQIQEKRLCDVIAVPSKRAPEPTFCFGNSPTATVPHLLRVTSSELHTTYRSKDQSSGQVKVQELLLDARATR